MARKRPRDDDDDDDDDAPPPPRRKKSRPRKRSSNSTPWIVGGVLGTLALVGIVVLVVSLTRGKDGSNGKDNPGGKMVRGPGGREFPEEMLINDAITFGSKLDVPANWTHQDLANYLRAKGLPVTIQNDPSLGSSNGQGVWFVDARPNMTRIGRVRVYRCPSKRDAAKQVVAMQAELWLPYVVGHFAVGFDGKENPSDDDIHFSTNVKSHLFQ